MEPAVLYLGMGCDSTRLIIKHLKTPRRKRKFKIEAVVSSQVGNESVLVKEQMENCLYPILAKEGIRTIQIARKSSSIKDGYVVLDDTTNPTVCYTRPTQGKIFHQLSDEMLWSGIIPQRAHKKRLCSSKFKKEILSEFHEKNFGSCVKLIGFNASERSRIERAKGTEEYIKGGNVRFPLHEEGETREQIEKFLYEFFKRRIWRSACVFCPFSMVAGSSSEIKLKYELVPEEAALAAYIEYIATCFNRKQTLFRNKTIIERKLLSTEALEIFEALLNEVTWKVYRIRRITDLKYRSVEAIFIGNREECNLFLMQESLAKGKVLEYCEHGIPRVYEEDIEGKDCLQFLVAAPGNPMDKERKCFQTVWEKRNGIYRQLDLFDQDVPYSGKGSENKLILTQQSEPVPMPKPEIVPIPLLLRV
jgi:hypothetical protein